MFAVVSSMHRRIHHLAFLHATLTVMTKSRRQPWRVFHELDQAASFNECSERFCVIQEQNRMVNEISKKLLSHSEPGHKFELKASVQMRMSAPEMYCASATCWRKLTHTSMRPS